MLSRLAKAWRTLQPERRLAALAAVGLFATLFLPWYQQTVLVVDKSGSPHHLSDAVSAFGAFSFVEAAVLLVAGGVLTLLFQRAEGRAFHLPGGDGWVISAAGAWTCLLVIWRIFDKNSAHLTGLAATTTGVEWGIFAALAVAGLLAYSGSRIRRARIPEPPLPDDDVDFVLPPRGGGRGSGGQASRSDQRATRARAASTAAGAGSRRRPARTDGLTFPAPEPLADPPAMRLYRGAAHPEDEAPTTAAPPPPAPGRIRRDDDDQLRIPFDDER